MDIGGLSTDYELLRNEVFLIVPHLYTVNPSFYSYFKSIMDQHQASNLLINEPVKAFTNIEGGLGVFAGMSFDSDSIIISTLELKKKGGE